MKRVLVTGATGFIGRHTLSHLIARGFEVHAVRYRTSDSELDGVTWHHCDLLQPDNIRALFSTIAPTHLMHMAWNVQPGIYLTSEDNLRWCKAGIELVQAFAAGGGERAVFAGTCFEYDLAFGYCSEEVTPCVPTTRYGISKLALAQIVTRSPPSGISTAWGRIFYLYGPYEAPGRLVPSVVCSFLKSERPKCTHGRQIRDFLHVDDVGSAFAALLDSGVEGVVNIGSGEPVAIRSMVSAIGRLIGTAREADFGALQTPPSDPNLVIADVRKLREAVGWTPSWQLADGLADVIEWWRRRKGMELRKA